MIDEEFDFVRERSLANERAQAFRFYSWAQHVRCDEINHVKARRLLQMLHAIDRPGQEVTLEKFPANGWEIADAEGVLPFLVTLKSVETVVGDEWRYAARVLWCKWESEGGPARAGWRSSGPRRETTPERNSA